VPRDDIRLKDRDCLMSKYVPMVSSLFFRLPITATRADTFTSVSEPRVCVLCFEGHIFVPISH
jgi:hypothetical protein